MTATLPNPGPVRLAVHSIDEFAFTVPDLSEARHFYESFGLEVRDEDGALGLYTEGHPHRWGKLLQGATKQLRWLTFGVHPGDMSAFERRVTEHKVERIAAPPGADDRGLWVRGPDGLALQLRVADKVSPSKPAPREFPAESGNAGRSQSRRHIAAVRPLYLSHLLTFTVDVDSAMRFYELVLGLRLSDKSGSVIAFMHSPHGSDHHLLALAKSDGPGLHHTSWCVPSIDAVGLGMQQMAGAGYDRRWGLGRHVLGSNYFCYVRDPWGSYAEYSYDIDYVQAGAEWPSADHPGEDSLYVWGPDVPEEFIVNHETAAH